MKFAQEFKPTRSMRAYAYQRAKVGDAATDVSIAEKIGMKSPSISNWKSIPGFLEWLDAQVTHYRRPIADMLEQVALDRLDDFRYWEAMAKKYGVITKDGEKPPLDDKGIRMSGDDLIDLVNRARTQKIAGVA